MSPPGRATRAARRTATAVLVAVLVASACTPGGVSPEPDDSQTTPTTPTPSARPRWVVTVGDSYLSGEGARWGGNTATRPQRIDALGPTAYDDGPDGETQPGCHRATESVATLDLPRVQGMNLACSGATARSRGGGDEPGRFMPGLDFFRDSDGNRGQASQLERFARSHDVSHVVVSVGGNDFGFGSVVSRCALGFIGLTGPREPCSSDPRLAAAFEPANAARVTGTIEAALDRVTTAMRRAGHRRDYTLVVQTYPSPLPRSTDNRYSRDSPRYQSGCPFFDADLDWAADDVLPVINASVTEAASTVTGPGVVTLDLSGAFAGHRLCERGVDTLDASGLRSWRSAGAAAALEWVNRIYFTFAPWQVQESLHPNHWGMLAQQRCLELVVTEATEGSVSCRPGRGLDNGGHPVMRLTP